MAAWGLNNFGQLGNSSTTTSTVPVLVDRSGVLAGKAIIGLAAGNSYSLALCFDGTLVGWGYGYYGQLGALNAQISNITPLAVNQTGVLAGKKVVKMAGGSKHTIALCSDGTVATWGDNASGQLGNNSTTQSLVPVLVDRTGVLAGRTVTAVAAGGNQCVALCADGTLTTWGDNTYGQLGNGSTTKSTVPVLVNRAGVLADKNVSAIAAGTYHCLALCSDGTSTAWGYNNYGQLGNNTTTNSSVPVIVNQAGVLADKVPVVLAAIGSHNLALCSDGTVVAWGYNSSGQLGNNSTTNSSVPVLVNTSGFGAGERVMSVGAGSQHSFAQVSSPPPPVASTLAATAITDTGATVNASVSGNGSSTVVSFQYGLTTSYGSTATAVPATVAGTSTTAASVTISGLLPGTTCHYRIIVTSGGGTVTGDDMTFTTTTFGTLADLTLSTGTLAPGFSNITFSYDATVPYGASRIALTPVAAFSSSMVAINGSHVDSGTASGLIDLAVGNNLIRAVVTAADGINSGIYTVVVTRLPERYTYSSAADAPLAAGGFSIAGSAAAFTLNYPPLPGANLAVLNNTGCGPIQGTFTNLTQGQLVPLTYGDVTYSFRANYFGGTGNDLVLQWANTRLLGWGSNSSGTLGNNSTANSSVPVAVDMSGVLADKTIIACAAGDSHSLALCADGTLAAWGNGNSGQLGNNSTGSTKIPVLVDPTGVLAGKTVIAIAVGAYHNLALCSDGSVAAWGNNGNGRLGNGSTTGSNVPVWVDKTGALVGKTVVAISAGASHSLALCSDGTVAAWGNNSSRQIGNLPASYSSVPVLVNSTGALAGKAVVAIAAGANHSLALCADGTVAALGYNGYGQLGVNNAIYNASVAVAVDRSGVLAGKTVTGIAAGTSYSLALCADGTMAAWGYNNCGQLGNGNTTQTYVPVLVNQTDMLANRCVVAVCAGGTHSLAWCADGSLATWGYNSYGQLGNNSTTNSSVPQIVGTSGLVTGARFVAAAGGAAHSLALAAYPLQSATPQPASAITGLSATLTGTVNACENAVTVAFEYGLDASYGNTVPASPDAVAGTSDTAVNVGIGGLTPGTLYHYRVVTTSYGGIVRGADLTFTTLSDNAQLAGLSLSAGLLAPDFVKTTTGYVATVPYATGGVTVTPGTDHFGASVQVEGVPVASGAASGVLGLPVGNTTLTTVVTAEDGIATMSYTITVTRLPMSFTFHAAGDVPVTADGFSAGGIPVDIVLGFAPVPGAILTMVNNRGLGFIHGTFGNLAQGQRVTLNFGGMGYDFVANYFGGTGNDLVLQWADTQVMAWGSNSYGQLGDATTTRRLLPTASADTGVLAGRTVVAVGTGYLHSLALCADGTLAAWGYNNYGQLGNHSTVPSSVPVAVDRSGVLADKTVIAIAAGPFHNLALCSDGTVAAWGYNNYGQLGTGTKTNSQVPVTVNPLGALANKQVVAVAAGAYSSFALCADGTLTAWGYNDEGELGDGTKTSSSVPVAVDRSGVLAGRQIAAVTAGQYHTLALCSDGTLVAWGYNNRGQLGNISTVSSSIPVAIGMSGDLTGKTVVATRASGAHSLALCSDGTVAAWGWNNRGQLGVPGIAQSTVPVAITPAGGADGAAVTRIAVGGSHGLLLCADGTMAAWGDNSSGQLGNNSLTQGAVPGAVDTSGLAPGARFMLVGSGAAAQHSLAVVALPTVGPAGLPGWLRNAGTAASGAAGAALDDFDNDGTPNLIEYAFALHLGGVLPQPQNSGGRLVLEFTEPAGVVGITYGAEWSATLQADSWTEVPDTGSGTAHLFSLPVGTAPRIFMRLKVSSP